MKIKEIRYKIDEYTNIFFHYNNKYINIIINIIYNYICNIIFIFISIIYTSKFSVLPNINDYLLFNYYNN